MSEAEAVTVVVPETIAPEPGVVMLTVGGVVSEATVTVAAMVALPVLPAASRAVTVSMFVPDWRTIPLTFQAVVPAAVPLPPRSFDHVT